MALVVALLSSSCAGDDPRLAPVPTPTPGSSVTTTGGVGAGLPFGPTAEDAVALFVELVLGHPFLGECRGAAELSDGEPRWCYQRGNEYRVGPLGGALEYELRLSESEEGWQVDEQIALE